MEYQQWLRERECQWEVDWVREDFSYLVSMFSDLYGNDLFGYLRKHADDLELRAKYVVDDHDGHRYFD